MNTLNTNGSIKTQASVLLYLLNFQKGKKFEVESNGKDLIIESGENELASFKKDHHIEHALKITNSNETIYFVEPLMVDTFPDNDNILKFHCKETILVTNNNFN